MNDWLKPDLYIGRCFSKAFVEPLAEYVFDKEIDGKEDLE